MSVEDIILDHDNRGMHMLRSSVPPDYCTRAAEFIQSHPGTVLVVTGFYIIGANAAETDGPPGAVAIGKALQMMGRRVVYVTDRYTSDILGGMEEGKAEVVDFPITGHEESRRVSREMLDQYHPSIIIAVERCSLTVQGFYRNMKGLDISEYTAKVDYLFRQHPHSIGIGDGGNEIGMGNISEVINQVPSLPDDPAATCTTHLVIASVSNWGALGLVAALSILEKRNMLPSLEEEAERIKKSVSLGAVDGMSKQQIPKVDSFTLEENEIILSRLHLLVKSECTI